MEELYQKYLKYPNVCTDTRAIEKDCLFFALKGERFNGNTFAVEAVKQGAAFAIVDEDVDPGNERLILVEDVLTTLQHLAKHHREQLSIPFVAVTGSNGKTTSKELIRAVLDKKYNVAYTKGNLNNHIGVPLTILDITPDHEIALVEMGDNHMKEVEFLCTIGQPTHGFVTNVGKDHLEGFGSFENNILAKKEVFDYLSAHDGIVFVDLSDELVANMASECDNQISYGVENADSYIIFTGANPLVSFQGQKQIISTNLFGGFNFNNVKLAYAIGEHFQVERNLIEEALSEYQPDNNRSQVVKTEKNTLIMDAYNANPSSVEHAVRSLKEMETTAPKIVLLGDMFELGSYAEMEHQNVANLVEEMNFDQGILVGENYGKVNGVSATMVFSNKEDAEVYIKKIAPEGAIILLKGSRGMRMESFKSIL